MDYGMIMLNTNEKYVHDTCIYQYCQILQLTDNKAANDIVAGSQAWL